jgi:site-specific DNA recombinase
LQARQEQLRSAKHRLNQQLERLTDAYLAAIIPLAEYQRRRHELEQKNQSLETQEKQLLCQVNRKQELLGITTSIEQFCERIRTGLENDNFEQRRRLVELLIDRVIVNDGDVEIRYVIPTAPNSEHIRFCHLRTDYFSHPDLVRTLNR